MKKLQLIFITLSFILGFISCASQKEVQKTPDETEAISTYTSDNTESTKMAESASEAITKTEPKIHIVQKGESLWVIARKYGVSVKALAETNNIENSSLIKINQELLIPEIKGN